MKILCVFGTRPEAIKLAPIIHELRRRSPDNNLQPVVCVTGQHRHMLDQVLHLFDIDADYDLQVMTDNQTPTQVASVILARLESILQAEQPDWMLVQGDTTTVTAAALAAFYNRVKVGHVEAGLRTGNKWRPFPEEINRKVATVIADAHFAPTEKSRQNLLGEGVSDERIVVTGNSVIDALYWVVEQPGPPEADALIQRCGLSNSTNENLPAKADHPGRRLILVTAHRRENFGPPLENICLAVRDIAARYADQIRIVYPVHLNPNVKEVAHRLLQDVPNIILTTPLNYSTLIHLMKRSHLILTDSGGIQEEAPGLGKPVLVLREATERPEAVQAGTVKLVGSDRDRIVTETVSLLENTAAYDRMAQAVNPYGDGRAANRIVAALLGENVEPFEPDQILSDNVRAQ